MNATSFGDSVTKKLSNFTEKLCQRQKTRFCFNNMGTAWKSFQRQSFRFQSAFLTVHNHLGSISNTAFSLVDNCQIQLELPSETILHGTNLVHKATISSQTPLCTRLLKHVFNLNTGGWKHSTVGKPGQLCRWWLWQILKQGILLVKNKSMQKRSLTYSYNAKDQQNRYVFIKPRVRLIESSCKTFATFACKSFVSQLWFKHSEYCAV